MHQKVRIPSLGSAKPFVALLAVVLVTLSTFAINLHSPRTALAATNNNINFQARLMSNTGGIVPDGYYNVEFKIYNALTSSGSSQGSCTGDANCLWAETYFDTNGVTAGNDFRVRVANGYLTVSLGSRNAFPATINWDQQLWIAMNIGGTTQTATPTYDGEMSPRLQLTGVPYAFRAGQLASLAGSFTGVLQFAASLAQNSTVTLPDPGASTATVCYWNSTSCGFVTGSTASYIQNQNIGAQTTSNFWISGTGRADTAFIAPALRATADSTTAIKLQNAAGTTTVLNVDTQNIRVGINNNAPGYTLDVTGDINSSATIRTTTLDTASGIALNIGASGGSPQTTQINLNQNTVVANNKTLTVGGDALFKDATNSQTAFQVQNSTAGSLLAIDTLYNNINLLGNNSGETGLWGTTATLPLARMNAGTATANGYVYVVGGGATTTAGSTTVYYARLNTDGTIPASGTGAWATTTALTGNARRNMGVVAGNGYLYVIAGFDTVGSASTATVNYAKINPNGTVGTWNTTTAIPTARQGITPVYANGYIYVVDGADDGPSVITDTRFVKVNADGTLGAWASTTSPGTDTFAYGAVATNNSIYILGGRGGAALTTVQRATLNTTTGAISGWVATDPALPLARQYLTAGISNGYIYAVGGSNGTTSQASVYYAPITTTNALGSWTLAGQSISARDAHTTIVVNGYLYAIGGNNAGTVSTATQYTSLARLKMGGNLDLVGFDTGNLADSFSGGNLTAGNTNVVGALQVQGSSSFAQSLSVGGVLTALSDASIAGVLTLGGGQAADITTTPSTTGTATALTLQPGLSGVANGTGAGSTIKAGDQNSTSCATACVGGSLTLQGGSATGASGTTRNGGSVTIDAGTGATNNGNVNVGATNAKTINLGINGAGSAVVQSINIGTNTTAGATNTVVIGKSSATASTVAIQGGTGASAITLATGTGGTISIGDVTNAVTQNINIGTNATASSTSNVTIGSTIAGTTILQGSVKVSTLATATANSAAVCRDTSTNALTSCDASNTTGRAFLQNGNAFGATGVLGTTDANSLQIITGASGPNVRATFDTSNNLYLGNGITAAAPNAFTVQGTGSATAGTTGAQLTVKGGAGASVTTGGVGGALLLAGGDAGGSGNNAGGTVTLQGGNKTNTGAAGTVLVKNLADSTAAFQVQNAAGTATALNVDTQNTRVGVGTGTPSRTLDISVNNSVVNALPVIIQQAGIGDTGIEFKSTSKNFYAGIDNTDGQFKISSAAAANGTFTQGNTTQEVGTPDSNANGEQAYKITASASGVVSSMSVYIAAVASPNNLIQFGIYSDNGSGTSPNALLASTGSQVATVGWNTISLSGVSITNGTIYWIAMAENGATTFARGSGGTTAYHTGSGYPLTNPFAANVGNSTDKPSFYITVATTGTADYFGGTPLFRMNDTGATVHQNSADSTTAFQVQNAAGSTLLGVDTTNATLNLGAVAGSTVASTLNVATSSNATQIVNIGSNSSGTAANGTLILMQGGNTSAGNGAVSIQTLAAGQLNIGSNNAANTIQVGSTSLSSGTQTINIGTGNTAGGTTNVNIGNTSVALAGTTTLQAKTSVVNTVNGVVRGTFDNANNLYLGLGATAGTPTNFTIAATGSATAGTAGANLNINGGAGSSATTGSSGGAVNITGGASNGTGNNQGGAASLTGGTGTGTAAGGTATLQGGGGGAGAAAAGGAVQIQGGTAAGTGASNGGTITLQGGTAAGSGVKGLIQLNGSTYFTSGIFSSGTTGTITQSLIDSNSSIMAAATAGSLTFTVPSPTLNTLSGRVLYITNNGANAFVLAGLANSSSFTLNTGSTATLIWQWSGASGSWTSAGVDASTMQNAYTNSTGNTTPEILVDSTRNGLDIQDNSLTSGTRLLAVRGTATASTLGSALFVVDNTGKVGIGIEQPTRTLDIAVNNAATTAPPVLIEQAGTGDATLEFKTPAKSWVVGADASNSSTLTFNSSSASSSANLGNTAANGGTDSADQNSMECSKYTASQSGTVTSISAKIGGNAVANSPNNHFSMAIYTGSAVQPLTLVANTATGTLLTTINTFNTLAISASVTNGTVYWLCANSDSNSSSLSNWAYDAGAANNEWFTGQTFGTWPASPTTGCGAGCQGTLNFGFYVTLTPTGSYDSFNSALLTLSDTGQANFRNFTNSSTAFQVQNAVSTTLFGVDTLTSSINVGATGTTATATTSNIGTSTGATQAINIGSATSGTAAAGTTVNIQGGTTANTAINIGTNGAGGITIDTGTTGNILIGAGTSNNAKTITLGPTATKTSATTIQIGVNTAGTETIQLGSATSGTAAAGTTVNIQGGTTANTAINIGTNGAGGITIDTGTTGNINIGTGANSKTVTMGSTTGTSSTVLQAGSGNIIAKVGTDSAVAFQVQNAAGATQLSLDTTNTSSSLNLAVNGGAETGGTFATNWTTHGTSTTISQDSVAGEFASGAAGVKVAVTAGTTTPGVRNNVGTAMSASTTYNISFSVKVSVAMTNANMAVVFSPTGTTSNNATCTTMSTSYGSINTSSFIKYSCWLTTTSTATTSSAYLALYQGDATLRNIFIDNLSIVAQNSSGTQDTGTLRVGGSSSQGLTLLTLDSYAATPFTGASASLAGSMYFDTTQGKIQCYDGSNWGACGAAPNSIITLTPEYTSAVLNGTGIGTLTSDFCANSAALTVGTLCGSNDSRNFYKWTSPQGTAQAYNIYVTYKLPSTFKGFVAGTTSMTGRVDSTTNAAVKYAIFKSTGSAITSCSASSTVVGWNGAASVGSANTWTTGVAGTLTGTTDPSTCGFVGGNNVIFQITVSANSNAAAYVENLNFTYTNQ